MGWTPVLFCPPWGLDAPSEHGVEMGGHPQGRCGAGVQGQSTSPSPAEWVYINGQRRVFPASPSVLNEAKQRCCYGLGAGREFMSSGCIKQMTRGVGPPTCRLTWWPEEKTIIVNPEVVVIQRREWVEMSSDVNVWPGGGSSVKGQQQPGDTAHSQDMPTGTAAS